MTRKTPVSRLSVGLAVTVILASCLVPMGIVMVAAFGATPPVVSSGPLRFEEHLIKDGYSYAFGIAAADLDGDGDLDLTSADAMGKNSLYWFENDGKGRFKQHVIQANEPVRPEKHAIGDIDGDGRADVVLVKNLHGDLLWFKNSGTPQDGKPWERHIITKGELPGAYDVALTDLDGDGDLDVAASSWILGNQFAWFENDSTPADGPWKKHLVEGDVAETRAILAADIDGDGDPDLVGSASAAHLLVWYENSGRPAAQPWKRHVIDGKSRRPIHGQTVDMDGDGDIDVLMAFGSDARGDPEVVHRVAWYENDGTPGGDNWKRHVMKVSILIYAN